MKLFRIVTRNIRDSFKSLIRNFSLSLASISCITITLMVVSLSMMLSVNVNNLTQKVKDDVTLVVFLDVDITEERRDEIESEIRKVSNIQPDEESVVLNDKESIRQEMMASSDTYAKIMANWESREDNPLQDAYHVKVVDITKMEETADEIRKIDGVDTVNDSEEIVNQLISVFDVITQGTYIVVIALIVVTAFLIANTIKITIDSRKREIDIMRLVGASNMNIKIPFIFEGLMLGFVGSIIPIAITIYGYSAFWNYFKGELFGKLITLTKPDPFVYQVSIILLLIGILVGMFGSWRAVKKHLKI